MARLDTLAAIEAEVWSQLALAPRDRAHPWRVGVLATSGDDAADARCVVLRDVDAARRCLVFYTDSRSPKARQIEAQPRGTLVMWSTALGWQLRMKVQLSLETAGLAVSSRWARLKMSPGAQDYLSPLPPGSAIDTPMPERGTREYFGMVTAQIDAIDWMELHAAGHRRAAFDAQGARWLVP
jgi:pyridoxamine 5'-phosphate oxidase